MVFYRNQIAWGFFPSIKQLAGNKDKLRPSAICTWDKDRNRDRSQRALPGSDQENVVWFGSRCRSLCTLTPSDCHPPLHLSELHMWWLVTSKSVCKHIYRKSLSQKTFNYILPLKHSTSSTQMALVRCINYQLSKENVLKLKLKMTFLVENEVKCPLMWK